MILRDIHSIARNGILYTAAGYGAGIVFGANAILSAKIAAIYSLTISISSLTYMHMGRQNRSLSQLNFIQFGVEAMAIIAARSLNLIGNKGLAILGTYAFARLAIQHYKL